MFRKKSSIQEYIVSLHQQSSIEGMKLHERNGAPENTLGVPMTNVRKLGASIRKDIRDEESLLQLAKGLWKTRITEARMLACIICPGKQLHKTLLKRWARSIRYTKLADIFVDEIVVKSKWAEPLFEEWKAKKDTIQRRLAYRSLLKLSRVTNHRSNDYYITELYDIEKGIVNADPYVAQAMNDAIVGIGSRNHKLNVVAQGVARRIGDLDARFEGMPIHFPNASEVLNSKKVQILLPD